MYAQRNDAVSPEQYLRREAVADSRSEYVDGEISAMTGGSQRHNVVTLNIAVALKTHPHGGPCRVFMSDAKLHAARATSYYYPDVMVSCEERLRELGPAEAVVSAPVLVVEVLPPATETIDRREKLTTYKKIETLREYLLVDPDGFDIELHRRVENGWEWLRHEPEDPVELVSVGVVLPRSALFDGLEPVGEETGAG